MSVTTEHFTFFFIHIPKTAGSTMQDVLGRQYKGLRSFTMAAHEHKVRGSLDAFRAMDAMEREKLDVVRGHCVLDVEDLVHGPKKYAAFLRDPFQQFKSLFFYIRRAHWNPHHERVKRLSGLHEYLEYQLDHGLDNMQTRHLSGVLDAMVPIAPNEAMRVHVDEFLFNKASQWLERLDHVGLTEQFDASLLMMKSGLGWRHHCHYQAQNRTIGRPDPDLDPMLEERFREMFHWDLRLYDMAKERFEIDVVSQGAGFPKRVQRFKQWNDMAQHLYRLRPDFLAARP